jgi:hypothetical protein
MTWITTGKLVENLSDIVQSLSHPNQPSNGLKDRVVLGDRRNNSYSMMVLS